MKKPVSSALLGSGAVHHPAAMRTPPSLFSLPQVIEDDAQLDDVLSRPRPALVEFIRQVHSPLLILGAGGKMGPTLAVLASRAAVAAGHKLRVAAVSRFRDAATREWLESRGVEAICCDLFDRKAMAGLPDAADILYLVGVKFGTNQNPSLTWRTRSSQPTWQSVSTRRESSRFPPATSIRWFLSPVAVRQRQIR